VRPSPEPAEPGRSPLFSIFFRETFPNPLDLFVFYLKNSGK
jgi:hypothetical protein